ncbi:hypothetical protein [Escherichia phage vB_EcoM_EP57]|nr:hypothetical protein [Escherichia phage vB_EcoM_EP57]
MISLESIAFKKGYTAGFKFGMFNKVNPYTKRNSKNGKMDFLKATRQRVGCKERI